MDNIVFGEETLKKIPPYDRLSILNISGRGIQASENQLIFSKCRPRSGTKDTKYKIDSGDFNKDEILSILDNFKESAEDIGVKDDIKQLDMMIAYFKTSWDNSTNSWSPCISVPPKFFTAITFSLRAVNNWP